MDTANTRMAFGRMALIGDAAFTARPTTGAGTTKAAINGIELGKALHGISTNGVVGALRECKLPGYRCHLGCILLKMAAISLLTGEAEQIVIGRTLVARGAAATDNPVVVSVSPQGGLRQPSQPRRPTPTVAATRAPSRRSRATTRLASWPQCRRTRQR